MALNTGCEAAKRYQRPNHSAKATNSSWYAQGGCSVRKKCVHLSSNIGGAGVHGKTYVLLLCATVYVSLASGQYHTTRDPRWYSREGDYSYHLPNPGDPDYRYGFYLRIYLVTDNCLILLTMLPMARSLFGASYG